MVTAYDIRAVRVFASLETPELERLARAAADISLAPAEYAANDGDKPALFAVLGERQPGDVFGEVPIALGTPYPVGFRAAVQTRVMRLEPRDYHAVAADTLEVAAEIGRLASTRMSGPSGLAGNASTPPAPRAVVVGDRWDPVASDLRR